MYKVLSVKICLICVICVQSATWRSKMNSHPSAPQSRIIRTKHPVQYLLAVFLWICFIALTYFAVHGVIGWRNPLLFTLMLIFLSGWLYRLQLVIEPEGIVYRSGWFKTERLGWEEIGRIHVFAEYLLVCLPDKKRSIGINYFYFRPRDMAGVIRAIVAHNPQVQLDGKAEKLLQRFAGDG